MSTSEFIGSSNNGSITALVDAFHDMESPMKSKASHSDLSLTDSSSSVILQLCLKKLADDLANIKLPGFFSKSDLMLLNDSDRKSLGEAICNSNFDNRGLYKNNGQNAPRGGRGATRIRRIRLM